MKSVRWRTIGILAVVATVILVYITHTSSTASPSQSKPAVVAAPTLAPTAAPTAVAAEAASKGSSVNHKAYTVTVLVPASVPAGKEGIVTVAITVKPGWKLNQEFPTKLVVTAPSGVTLKKDKLRVADATVFSEKKGSFPVVFTASGAGAKSFSAKFRFAVCTDATCDPKTEELRWAVTVD